MAPADDLADGDSLLPFQPPCASDPGSWCEVIYRLTNSDMLARSADTIITKTAHIALTIVIALLVRYLLHRMINRIVAGATSSKVTRLASRLPAAQQSLLGFVVDRGVRAMITLTDGITATISHGELRRNVLDAWCEEAGDYLEFPLSEIASVTSAY